MAATWAGELTVRHTCIVEQSESERWPDICSSIQCDWWFLKCHICMSLVTLMSTFLTCGLVCTCAVTDLCNILRHGTSTEPKVHSYLCKYESNAAGIVALLDLSGTPCVELICVILGLFIIPACICSDSRRHTTHNEAK